MSILTNALRTADKITKSLKLQTTVTFYRYRAGDGYGSETYGSAVSLSAVVEYKQRSIKTQSGEMAQSVATLTLLDLPALVAATPAVTGGGKAGWVFVKDQIVLPDSSKPPILNVGGFVDGGSGNLIPTEVYLG